MVEIGPCLRSATRFEHGAATADYTHAWIVSLKKNKHIVIPIGIHAWLDLIARTAPVALTSAALQWCWFTWSANQLNAKAIIETAPCAGSIVPAARGELQLAMSQYDKQTKTTSSELWLWWHLSDEWWGPHHEASNCKCMFFHICQIRQFHVIVSR